MKIITRILALAIAGTALSSCHSIDNYQGGGEGNFDQLWRLFDQHYCFFEQKGVDWDAAYAEFAPRAEQCITEAELFAVCTEMLDRLQDGHVNVSTWFNTYYYRRWWSDYPQDYNERVVLDNYLHFNYRQLGAVTFGVLPGNVGYMRIPTFDAGLGDSNMTAIFNHLRLCAGLVIDVRDNGGGSMDNVEDIACRFMQTRTLAGYIIHKTGPGHNDFSEPYAYYYAPPAGWDVWTKPVVVLCNRSTFSAANNFVSVMQQLPQVTVVGARTGGGSGMPMSYELSCGWGVRMSASPVLDAQGRGTEDGVMPDIEATITDADTAAGRDPIIDAAIALLTGIQAE